METAVLKIVRFMNGRFGNRRLKTPLRQAWRLLTWGCLVYLLVAYILLPISEGLDWVTACMNYVRWGI